MINRVVLVGRLTKDPELKYTQSGIAVTRFTLAVNRTFTNQQGQREADFVNCVSWRKQAENIANFLRKGSLVGVDGRIQTSSFDGKDGNRVFMTEVVAESVQFLESRSATENRAPGQGQQQQSYQGGAGGYQQYQNTPPSYSNDYQRPEYGANAKVPGVGDDDLPF